MPFAETVPSSQNNKKPSFLFNLSENDLDFFEYSKSSKSNRSFNVHQYLKMYELFNI